MYGLIVPTRIMEEVAVDPTSPLLDLSYRGIAQFQLQNSSPYLRALVLSGNPISDFSFLRFLPALEGLRHNPFISDMEMRGR